MCRPGEGRAHNRYLAETEGSRCRKLTRRLPEPRAKLPLSSGRSATALPSAPRPSMLAVQVKVMAKKRCPQEVPSLAVQRKVRKCLLKTRRRAGELRGGALTRIAGVSHMNTRSHVVMVCEFRQLGGTLKHTWPRRCLLLNAQLAQTRPPRLSASCTSRVRVLPGNAHVLRAPTWRPRCLACSRLLCRPLSLLRQRPLLRQAARRPRHCWHHLTTCSALALWPWGSYPPTEVSTRSWRRTLTAGR